MNLDWSPEDKAFRAELEEFFTANPPPKESEDQAAYRQVLYDHGWPTMHWPTEYGGKGAGHMQQLLVKEVADRHGVRIGSSGTNMFGPTLKLHGTEEQRTKFLPAISRGEMEWCQGFSEPGAGSDLASLQTRAVKDGDDYIINGQKIWTSQAHNADWIFVLVRTDTDAPKHRGISYLLADMKTPGVDVRPLINAAGDHSFNEVYFEDVRVPVANLVGEENRGWYVATTTLDFERSGIERVFTADKDLTRIEGFLRSRKATFADADRSMRSKVAELRIQVEISRLLAYRVAWMQGNNLVPNHEASMAKLFSSDVGQRAAWAGANASKMYGQLGSDEPAAPFDGALTHRYLDSIRLTIGRGTGEIQRNVVATRGLGLPRG
jgi:alkylation response protein AidB-like acyl-CoA dehydrogenase